MIEIKDLSVSYGANEVLKGANVTFEKGSLTGLIGANGCGKSTLLKSIVGTVRPHFGKVLLDGADCSKMKRNDIARRIAYLSQERNIPDMTVMQLVLHGRFPYLSYPSDYTKNDKEIAYSAMERVNISNLAETPLYALSGGMRQSAYIAMALAQDTEYILLDEPTSYLDISHQLELMRLLRKLADMGKGIVTVIHDLPLAFDFCDEIAVLNGGEISIKARPCDLITDKSVRDIFNVDMKYDENDEKYYYTYKK